MIVRNNLILPSHGEAITNLRPALAGVPQGSVLVLYLLYTADLPTNKKVTVGTFADDTAILTSHSESKVASAIL